MIPENTRFSFRCYLDPYRAVGAGLFSGCPGTDPLRCALDPADILTLVHLPDAGAVAGFLMPSTLAAFLTSGALTHRSAP